MRKGPAGWEWGKYTVTDTCENIIVELIILYVKWKYCFLFIYLFYFTFKIESYYVVLTVRELIM